ncbi:baseplate J-like protein [Haloarcula tailed virus 2]|uniref:Baseplate J-like protein n=1 Tax=Haloarcula tailed virus 2 TaxID=2877989 RepID=A0AAE8Y0M1_9CAUD|nr:baseplate J-like protein [Haloarcula tailed virus 2]UBF23179.1 baseplate J-like protein [Haloarcula tailed virus 2]
MPVNNNGDFVQRSEATLQTFLENELRSEFGQDVDLSESSVFESLIRMLSGVLAENQEVDLAEVYNSAFLETAEGVNLDRVVEILGISRISAIKSTGVVTLSRSTPVSSDQTVQGDTVVQTGGSTPIRYILDGSVVFNFYDGFEDGDIAEYTDTSGGSSFATSTVEAFDGTFSLRSNGSGRVYRTDKQTQNGDQFSARVFHTDGGPVDSEILFGTQDEDNTYKAVVDPSGTLSLVKRESGVDDVLDTATGLTVPQGQWNQVEVDWGVRNINDDARITVRLLTSSGSEIAEISAVDGFRLSGGFGFGSSDTNVTYFDNFASRGRSVNITAEVGGAEGNIPANSISTAPILPSAVDFINNPYPVGDIDYVQLDGDTYTLGEDEELDQDLRERTRESLGAAGAATINAIASAIQAVQNVQSVTMFENDDNSTDAQGRPAFSFEAVVFGGADQDIIDAIGSVRGATSHADGGHVGSEVSGTWTSDVTDDSFSFSFSRPNELAVDITLDLVINDEYIGNEALRNNIVEYIGGILSDGSSEIGLGVGEDVKIDQIEDIVIGPDETGVVGIVSLSTTPSATTDANSLEVVDVASNEVAATDASDGSITITTTEE